MGLAGWLINETCCSEESDILLIALRECPGTLDETRSRLIVLYGPVHEWLCRGMRCSVKTSDTLFLTCQLAFKRAIACHCVHCTQSMKAHLAKKSSSQMLLIDSAMYILVSISLFCANV